MLYPLLHAYILNFFFLIVYRHFIGYFGERATEQVHSWPQRRGSYCHKEVSSLRSPSVCYPECGNGFLQKEKVRSWHHWHMLTQQTNNGIINKKNTNSIFIFLCKATSSLSLSGNVGEFFRRFCPMLWKSCAMWQSHWLYQCAWVSQDLQLPSLWPAPALMLFRAVRSYSLLNLCLQDPHLISPAGWLDYKSEQR